MVHAIRMPKPGQMTETCVLSMWRKEVGDPVHRGEVVFEIETDKSSMEVEAFDDGVLLAQLVPAGAEVPVNEICAYVGEPGEAIPDLPPAPDTATAPGEAASVASAASPTAAPGAASGPRAPGTVPGNLPAHEPAGPVSAVAVAGTVRLRVSPRASGLAAAAGLDLTNVTGTGPGGRIVESDVVAAIAAREAPTAAAGATGGPGATGAPAPHVAPGRTPVPAADAPDGAPDGEPAARPLSRMRRVIAERLTTSWTTIPQFTVTVAVDVSSLVARRAELNAAGADITITDLVLEATARTLVEFPDVNARTDGASIWPRPRIHLGVAVSVPAGLVVPVLRDADRLGVHEIHERTAAFAAAARVGTLAVDDMTGGTFTVSNLGMFGVDEFAAIINPGEAAILAVSSAIPTPVAAGEAVVIRPVMRLTLTADHRIVDGATAARFLAALRARLEGERPAAVGLADGGVAAPIPASTAAPPTGAPAAATAAETADPRRPRAVHGPDSFDLLVLGAGTGGYSAAFRAAQLGLKVALVDEDRVGGTCLHRGCIPTKAILEAADLAHRAREGAAMGIGVGEVSVDYATVARRKDEVVGRVWTGLKALVGKNGVEWVAGRGRLDGPGRVRVRLEATADVPDSPAERVLEGADVIVATGSRVKALPGIAPDGVRILTSDDVLARTVLPASIVIVGAGAVGVEFASALHDLGVAVTLLEYLPVLVPLEDGEVSRELERSFRRRGITVITSARFDPASVVVAEDGIRLTVGPEGGAATEIGAECLLVATGRAANVEDIGLETTRAVVRDGIIEVDGHLQTAEPHLWAIGDVVGGLWLAHTAAREGLTAVHTIVGDHVPAIDYAAQPRATYARPEIASIGLTEEQCASRGLATRIGTVPFRAIAKAVIVGERDGFAKVIADARTGSLLGVHIVGPHATELIAEASLATTLEATAAAIGATTHAHPTLSEVLAEAAMAVEGRSLNF